MQKTTGTVQVGSCPSSCQPIDLGVACDLAIQHKRVDDVDHTVTAQIGNGRLPVRQSALSADRAEQRKRVVHIDHIVAVQITGHGRPLKILSMGVPP